MEEAINLSRLSLKPPLRKIQIPRFPSVPYKDKESPIIEGFDTETDKTGRARVICDSVGGIEIEEPKDWMEFLTQKRRRASLNFFFNQRFDFEALIHSAGIDAIAPLNMVHRARIGDFEAAFIPEKMFSLTDANRHVYKFFDISPFVQMPLELAASKYLNRTIDHTMKEDRGLLFELHTIPEILEYCTEDARATKDLAEQNVRGMERLGIHTRNYTSPARVMQTMIVNQIRNYPDMMAVPRIVNNVAWDAYSGGWIDCYKRGYFARTTHLDQSSSYSFNGTKIPDFRKGHWKEGYEPDSEYGFMRVLVRGGPVDRCNPLAIAVKGYNVYPNFDVWTQKSITFEAYRTLSPYFEIRPLVSYSWVPHGPIEYPFKELNERMYEERVKYKESDPSHANLLKLMPNSEYGKTCQKRKIGPDRWRAGALFSPAAAAIFCDKTRLAMFREAIKAPEKVLMICTDGLIMEGKHRTKYGTGFGDIALKWEGKKTVIVKSGIYQAEHMKGAKNRGFDYYEIVKGKDGKEERRGLNLFERLDSKEKELNLRIRRVIHLHEARKCPEKLASFVTEERKLCYNFEKEDPKRSWFRPGPAVPRDLLENTYSSGAWPATSLELFV